MGVTKQVKVMLRQKLSVVREEILMICLDAV